MKQYAAEISFVDDYVGQVVANLKKLELYDESLIIVVGDHGEHLTEHDLYFTIDEDLHWHMMLAHKGKDDVKVDVKLELQDADESSRLTVAVMAAKSDKEGTMKISFGKKACSMTFMAAASDK